MSSKKRRRQQENKQQQKGLTLRKIVPKTSSQQEVFEAFDDDKHLLLHGMAGTGKTFLAMYLGLKDVLENYSYNNVTIIRSTVPVREMGFLPGKEKEKFEPYEVPYRSICSELFNRGDAYDILKYKDTIRFESTAFTRGRTFINSLIIVDEINNLSFQELDTVMTRLGQGSRIIFCGDYRQTDFVLDRDKKGLQKFIKILDCLTEFEHVEFFREDIVRSSIVKSYITAREMERDYELQSIAA